MSLREATRNPSQKMLIVWKQDLRIRDLTGRHSCFAAKEGRIEACISALESNGEIFSTQRLDVTLIARHNDPSFSWLCPRLDLAAVLKLRRLASSSRLLPVQHP